MPSNPHYQPSFSSMKVDPNSDLGRQIEADIKADIARQDRIDANGLAADHHLNDSDLPDFGWQ